MLEKALVGLLGIWAGLLGYSAYYNSSSVMNAAVIIFFVALLAFATRSYEAIWKSIGLLQQPPIMALIGVAAGYYYFSMDGFGFFPSSSAATGLALIGFAFGTVVYAYWNIA
ncbi:MAG: hypothetical protein R6V35_06015 [Candidatus Nanohaloarchaea archaeon]